jgi:hypothetical protein
VKRFALVGLAAVTLTTMALTMSGVLNGRAPRWLVLVLLLLVSVATMWAGYVYGRNSRLKEGMRSRDGDSAPAGTGSNVRIVLAWIIMAMGLLRFVTFIITEESTTVSTMMFQGLGPIFMAGLGYISGRIAAGGDDSGRERKAKG